jgi:hypothetical protein
VFLLLLAFAVVPVLLCAKPCIISRQQKVRITHHSACVDDSFPRQRVWTCATFPLVLTGPFVFGSICVPQALKKDDHHVLAREEDEEHGDHGHGGGHGGGHEEHGTGAH